MIIIAFFIWHWYASLFCQTFFLHRYAAHKSFTMSKTWEKVFYIVTWICQGSSYLSPYGYGVMHRLHHAYPDTEKDPHSPKYSDNLFSMMWDTKNIYSAIKRDQYPVEEQYKKGVPNWKAFDKFASSWFSKLGWGIFYTLFYIQFADHWWMFLLLPIHYLMGPVHGAVINWFAHKIGYVNFKVSDTSKNILPFDFLMFGEGYHNNHHKYGGRANFGVKWFEIDPGYVMIKIISAFGIIKIKKAQS
ncbi:MAG: acyl-CoA desaturase [Flammeovirgaceae bacterium]|nr:acyl-CoA desaturase [Flammeovirgaceae bacterium]